MANFPKPSELETQYLQILKGLKPDINTNDKTSDFVIRGRVFARMLSGVYGDQSKVNNDTYVKSARPEALVLRGEDLALPRQPETSARSPQVRIPGTIGTPVSIGLQLRYIPTGISYQVTVAGVIGGSGYFDTTVEALSAGQIGNVEAPDSLLIVSPPPGIGANASIIQSLADGSDIESIDSYRQRILNRYQSPPAGGNESDYPQFAFEADDSVRTALIKRFGRGLGTVDVYITTGTTDIDTAVTNDLSVVRIPSNILLQTVQDYYDAKAPLTDCPRVYGPVEINVDVTVKYVLTSGLTLTSVPSDPINNPLGKNCGELIDREVARALYKHPVGGIKKPSITNGFIMASAIEEGLDQWLSAQNDYNTGQPIGKIPILIDRQVQPLDSPNYDLQVNANVIAAPGVITKTAGV